MAVHPKLFEMARRRAPEPLEDHITELYIDTATYNALDRAGITRVTAVGALYEEHGSIGGVVPGIGDRRSDDLEEALALYRECKLDTPPTRRLMQVVAPVGEERSTPAQKQAEAEAFMRIANAVEVELRNVSCEHWHDTLKATTERLRAAAERRSYRPTLGEAS